MTHDQKGRLQAAVARIAAARAAREAVAEEALAELEAEAARHETPPTPADPPADPPTPADPAEALRAAQQS